MTMKQTFQGDRYCITLEADELDGYFEISAVHKGSGRKSSVTNVNMVISEILRFVLDDENTDFGESWLTISDRVQHKRLTKWTIRCLKDRHWVVNHLEKAFDEDMEYGGWNSDMNEIAIGGMV